MLIVKIKFNALFTFALNINITLFVDNPIDYSRHKSIIKIRFLNFWDLVKQIAI